ncbi:MAG: hypothetical protein ACHQ4G_09805 [Opitutales bacterium]
MRLPTRIFVPGLLLLALLVIGVFAPVTHFEFVRWDDDNNFTQNSMLTEPWSLALAKKMFTADRALRFEPVQWLCCRVVYAAAGFEPGVWHAVGLSWHVLATLLFAVALRQFLRRIDPAAGSRADLLALLGAAMWGVHPLRAETVGWVTASTYPLAGVFLLASFVCYQQAGESGRRSLAWLGSSWVLAVLGYASYPVGVTYGLWLVVYDLWRNRRGLGAADPRRWRWWAKHALFLLPAVLAVAVTVWSRYADPGIFSEAPNLATTGLPARLVMALAGMAALAWSLVWPVQLSPNRPPLHIEAAGTLPLVLLAALAAVVALLAAWQGRKRWPGLALVVFGFAGLSIPCLGLTERPTWPVDRYSYLVHLILIGGAATLVLRWTERRLAMIAGIAVLALGTAAVAARKQTMTWRDSETLFTQMAHDSRFADNPRQQGLVYILWGRYLVVRHDPARAAEMLNRAQHVYLQAISDALAHEDYPEALGLLSHEEHYFGLTPILRREKGAWLLRLHRPLDALRELRRADAALPGDPRTQTLLQQATNAALSAAHTH